MSKYFHMGQVKRYGVNLLLFCFVLMVAYGCGSSSTATITPPDSPTVTPPDSPTVTPPDSPTVTPLFSSTATGLKVEFQNLSTAEHSTITTSSWGFGDGTTSTEANPTHIYAAEGEYDVTLTITSSADAVSVYTNKIQIALSTVSFGSDPSALSVSDDKRVLSTWGSNSYGQLGNGKSTRTQYTPQYIETLSAQTVTKVVTDPHHSYVFALTAGGKIYSWDSINDTGHLGIGSTSPSLMPRQVLIPVGEEVTDIATSSHSIFALTKSGKVYAWGHNSFGELGLGDMDTQFTPEVVTFPNGEVIASLGVGYGGYAVTTSGKVYAWGNNSYGQLGTGDATATNTPTLTIGLPSGDKVASVTAADDSAFAITESGRAYAWGLNDQGQLGLGTKDNVFTPTQINIGENTTNIYPDSATGSTFAVTDNGTVFGWGAKLLGGNDYTESSTHPTPIMIPDSEKAKRLVVGTDSLDPVTRFIITQSGKVYTWGDNREGQLGMGDTSSIEVPTQLVLPNSAKVADIATLGTSTLAITVDGKSYGWGSNEDGQLGHGKDPFESLTPKEILPPTGEKFAKLAQSNKKVSYGVTASGKLYAWGTGDALGLVFKSELTPTAVTIPGNNDKIKFGAMSYISSYALTVGGKAYAWGNNKAGNLGTGKDINESSPKEIIMPAGVLIDSITLAELSIFALTTDHKLYAWGSNASGQLGLGDKDLSTNTPQQVTALNNEAVISIVGGVTPSDFTRTSYALTATGKVYSWGSHWSGGLGLGPDSEDTEYLPKEITMLADKKVISITVPKYNQDPSAYASTADGKLYVWGFNGMGQLGLGNMDDQHTPQEVTALSNEVIATVAVNSNSAFSVTKEGKVYAAGLNDVGQLGLGNTIEQLTPRLITGIPEPVRRVVADEESVYAITTSDKVYAWGKNNLGQLGLGNNEYKTTPQLVTGLTDVLTVTANLGSVIAITVDDKKYAWGRNEAGQLGLGDVENRNVPTLMK